MDSIRLPVYISLNNKWKFIYSHNAKDIKINLYNLTGIKPTYFRCIESCSACCERPDGFVFISEQEVEKAARYLEMESDEFLLHFTRKMDDRLILANGENDHCVFLEEQQCLIYEERPAQCRAYPFWPENLKNRHTWQRTKEECPGIGQGPLYGKEEILNILDHHK